MTDATVKCRDCGFLTVERGAAKEHIEPPTAMREGGTRPDATIGFAPVCHVHACDITSEYHANQPSGDGKGPAFLAVIRTTRVCPKFVPHQRGLTPAELFDRMRALGDAKDKRMLDMELLRLQAELAERAAERQRLWQESQDAKRIADQKERDKIQDTRNKAEDQREKDRQWWDVVKFCVTGVAIALATMVAFFGARHFAELDRQAADERKAGQVSPKQ